MQGQWNWDDTSSLGSTRELPPAKKLSETVDRLVAVFVPCDAWAWQRDVSARSREEVMNSWHAVGSSVAASRIYSRINDVYIFSTTKHRLQSTLDSLLQLHYAPPRKPRTFSSYQLLVLVVRVMNSKRLVLLLVGKVPYAAQKDSCHPLSDIRVGRAGSPGGLRLAF